MISYSPLQITIRVKKIPAQQILKTGLCISNNTYLTMYTALKLFEQYDIKPDEICIFTDKIPQKTPLDYKKNCVGYNKLIKLLQDKGISCRNLSLSIGSHESFMHECLFNKHFMSYATLRRIAHVLNISTDDLWEKVNPNETPSHARISIPAGYYKGNVDLSPLFSLIKNSNISGRQLALKLGFNKSFFPQIKISGHCSYKALLTVADFFKVSPDSLWKKVSSNKTPSTTDIFTNNKQLDLDFN